MRRCNTGYFIVNAHQLYNATYIRFRIRCYVISIFDQTLYNPANPLNPTTPSYTIRVED